MKRQSVLISIIAGGLGLLATVAVTAGIVSALTATNIRDTQTQNSPLVKNTNRTTQILEDCTTPGGTCFKRSRAQTAEAIGSINAVNMAAIYCRDQVLPVVYTYPELVTCVAEIVDGKKGTK